MSLDAMLAAHDDTALEALTSKGLVRRAGRDAEAGKATITSRDATAAVIEADGYTVEIDEGGAKAARCPCPATGVCRHIILAVMTLRESGGDTAPPDLPLAQDELSQLSQEAVQKFAGADWDKAVNLARVSTDAKIEPEGLNLRVTLPDAPAPVVFMAGQALKEAVFKGPQTRKRLFVAAATVAFRAISGAQPLDTLSDVAPADDQLTADLLDDVGKTLELAVQAVLTGGSALAEDQLFDLAITSRAQAAPRLTALLRGLAKQAQLARDRHVDFSTENFLRTAAATYALTTALKSAPGDVKLTGTLKRNYKPASASDLIVLGAKTWQGLSGARGLSVYGFDIVRQSWLTATVARAAGADPTFSPQGAYFGPFLGGSMTQALMGQHLQIDDLQLSDDNQIAPSCFGQVKAAISTADLTQLHDDGILHTNWMTLRQDLATRMGGGLRQSGFAQPVLMHPAKIEGYVFDDFDQAYRLVVVDQARATLQLTFGADAQRYITWLYDNLRHVQAILCEAMITDGLLRLSPVSVIVTDKGALTVHNFGLDALPRQEQRGMLAGLLKRFSQIPRVDLTSGVQTDPIQRLCADAIEAAGETLSFSVSDKLSVIARRADAIGLSMLARGAEALTSDPTPAHALRLTYLASACQASVIA
ncbi:hypothetical protein [Pseudaestuariivita rosea]|uniref:hypothetical protein n=1 Tax=Pseudaestuariivita rosea TaxID=2763263 RepID=UPI001ABB6E16|nr:hypothetical protein [Pseudaestuariivita rosea]